MPTSPSPAPARNLWLYGSSVLAVLLLLQLETSTWLFPLPLLLVLPGLVGCFVIGWWKRHALRAYALLTAGLLLLQIPAFPLLHSLQDNATQRRAQVVIRQLKRYRTEHGAYPESLAQLLPQYALEVPQTGFGLLYPAPFFYKLQPTGTAPEGSAFELSYAQGLLFQAIYSSQSKKWFYHE